MTKRFYVTMTWDDWPEGGSYGTIIEANDDGEVTERCRNEMAEVRAEGSDDDAGHYLTSYGDQWHVVDCWDLDEFIMRHLKSKFPPEDWQSEVANGDTRLGYDAWRNVKICQFIEDAD